MAQEGWIVTRELRGTFGPELVRWFWNGKRWTKDPHRAKVYTRIEGENEVDRQVVGRPDEFIRQNLIDLMFTGNLLRD